MEALPELKTLRNKYLKFLSIFDSENIIESEKNIISFLTYIENNRNLNKLIELNKNLEKEINKIGRQIRAIEWILSEG